MMFFNNQNKIDNSVQDIQAGYQRPDYKSLEITADTNSELVANIISDRLINMIRQELLTPIPELQKTGD